MTRAKDAIAGTERKSMWNSLNRIKAVSLCETQEQTIEDATRAHIAKSYVEELMKNDERSTYIIVDKEAMCSILGIEQKGKEDDR